MKRRPLPKGRLNLVTGNSEGFLKTGYKSLQTRYSGFNLGEHDGAEENQPTCRAKLEIGYLVIYRLTRVDGRKQNPEPRSVIMMLTIESLLVGASTSQPKDKVAISCITIMHTFILRQNDLALKRAMRIGTVCTSYIRPYFSLQKLLS